LIGGRPDGPLSTPTDPCNTHLEGGVARQDFDATLELLGEVQPWMDRGQKKSARGFARLQDLSHRRYDGLAVYRCESGTGEVPISFPEVDEDGLSGLLTVNIEI
jgi:hypothetical protein